MKLRFGLIVALLVLGARVAAAADVTTWTVDGVKREAMIYVPSSPPAGKLPLIFSFHGHGDDMENFQFVGLQDAWPDAIVVYFQGLPSRDGYRGWQVERRIRRSRSETGRCRAGGVEERIRQRRRRRIYATGYCSNGAHFTYCKGAASNVFAAYAPVGRIRATAMPKEPRPLFHVGGLAGRAGGLRGSEGGDGDCDARERRRRQRKNRAATVHPLRSGGRQPRHDVDSSGRTRASRGTSEKIVQFFHDHSR
jgi:polyhydroxybutyrate depolymerase